MEFRMSTREDLPGIMDVIADGRRALAALGIDQWQHSYPSEEIVIEDIDAGHGFLAVEDDRILGIASALFVGEKIYDTIDGPGWLTDSASHEPRYCTVHRVAVSKGATGKGVAKFLMANIERLAAQMGSESVRVDTHQGNAPMRGLLLRCGYQECGIVHMVHTPEADTARVAFEKLIEEPRA